MSGSFIEFWSALLESVQRSIQAYGPRAVLVVVVFTSFFLVAQLFKMYSNRVFDVDLYRKPTPESVHRYNKERRKVFVGRFFWLTFLVLAWSTAIAVSGIRITSILEGLGFVSLGLSFALSDLIQQYIAGFLILNQRHFNIGEQITLEKTTGVIKAIEPRYTIVRDYKENDVMVPNMEILRHAVTISEVQHMQRDVFHVRIGNESDVRKAIKIGEQAIATTRGVDTTVAPRGYLRYFGDSMQLSFYYSGPAARREHFVLRSAVLLNVNDAFKNNGIKIAYPSGVNTEEVEID